MILELCKWLFYILACLWLIVTVGGLIVLGVVHIYWKIKRRKERK